MFLWYVLLLFGGGVQAADLAPLFANPRLWALTPEEFQRLPETKEFRWNSAAHDSARAAGEGCTVFALPAVEVVARFSGGRLSEITSTIYARGDAGDLPKEKKNAPAGGDEMAMMMMQQMFKDMKVSLAIEVAGKIVQSNAEYQDGTRVMLMEMDFNKVLANPEKFKALA